MFEVINTASGKYCKVVTVFQIHIFSNLGKYKCDLPATVLILLEPEL